MAREIESCDDWIEVGTKEDQNSFTVSLWTRALSDEEVWELYERERTENN